MIRAAPERLVLFDIDGTILSSRGAAARAFRTALEEVFGTSGPTEGYSFGGRTDPQIARDLLVMAGFDLDEVLAKLSRVWPLYTSLLREEFTRVTPSIYPGVVELIDRLEGEPAVGVLGLLTGNILEGARLKLDAAAIGHHRFKVGAFGSDHHERRELPAIAVQRAEAAVGHRFEGNAVVIIGDTPFDISCGEHLGVRTIAVATGTYPLADLARCNPDHLFADLSDTDAVWEAIFAQ